MICKKKLCYKKSNNQNKEFIWTAKQIHVLHRFAHTQTQNKVEKMFYLEDVVDAYNIVK